MTPLALAVLLVFTVPTIALLLVITIITLIDRITNRRPLADAERRWAQAREQAK